MPHFLAIAWMHRDDYASAGMPLLPVIEPDGRSTGRQAVLFAAAMIPVSLLPTLIGLAGPRYLAAALRARRDRAVAGVRVRAPTRTQVSARRLFFATIIYLPLLWGALVADHAAARALSTWTRTSAARPPSPSRVATRRDEAALFCAARQRAAPGETSPKLEERRRVALPH